VTRSPAVGEQRHRSEQRSGHDLADHHDGGQDDHEPGAALLAGMLWTEEYVIVSPLIERMWVHRLVSGACVRWRIGRI